MEITDVTAVTVDMPLVDIDERLGIGPYVTNHGCLESMERVLVRVDTDEGVSGWGEMRVFLSPAATESILEDGVGPMIQGQSPFEIERLRRQVFVEYTNVDMFFSAVETACWDIVGKTLDRPVYELLGGWTAPSQGSQQHRQVSDGDSTSPDAVPVAFCLGILPLDESRVKAREALEAGFDVLKTKAGKDWRADVERISAMHDEVGGQLEFRLDPNQGWTLDQAVRVGAMLEDEGIYLQYMEQPIRVDAHRSLSRLRQRLRQPIAPNEDTYISHNIQSLVEAGAMDVGVIDLTPAGGISGLRQQAAVLEDAGVPFTHHCAFDLGIRTAAILHAFIGIPGFSLPPDSTYYGWEDDVIESPFEVSDGCLPAPRGPGLGISVDEDAVEEYRIS
ncbi:mandelate racemase/muconate lactonizing enzyme family protein [Haloarcula amylovorans]|uniref:mandelate racemase/muconate lactonizing enzyme family protein n=1 Tax=Haloarcula amylovorans TaxID=2562280 RepID=UPI0010768A59|nr:mandelate racemase/muconate lactonizing enzyme family protein [Halomicroarcula amylolytica]